MLSSEKSQTIAAFWLVGAAIGAGLAVAGGLSNWQLRPQALRMLRGLAAGSLGGVAGGWLGAMIYQMFSTAGGDGSAGAGRWWLRPVGWMAAGALVGLADGLVVLSPNRIRNGLIGGLAGGLIGGILFDPIKALVAQTAGRGDPTFPFEITSRAAGFVAVGLCIGGAVGLTNLLLKHAWLTVLDGDRPGRQVIFSGSSLTLGSDPVADLPFLREADRSLSPTHLRIIRGREGSFRLQSGSGAADAEITIVRNGVRTTIAREDQDPKGVILENDCVIICGRNSIRFNEKSSRSVPQAAPAKTHADRRPAQEQPTLQRDKATSPPAATPPSRPPPPKAAPAPVGPPAPRITKPAAAPPAPQSQPAGGVENVCPNGHKVPPGQRYCIVCDMFF